MLFMSLSKCAAPMGSCLKYTILTMPLSLHLMTWPKSSQIITFAGTGAHYHNGMAEHVIWTITNMGSMHDDATCSHTLDWCNWCHSMADDINPNNNIFIITCHVWKLEFLLWICSQRQDGSSRRSFMTVMFGDAQYMCWTILLAMERRSQSGSCDLSEPSTWETCQIIPE